MSNIIKLFSSPSSLKIGGGEIKKIYVGNKDVSSMYIGNTLIYSLGDTPNIPTEQPIMDGLICWLDAWDSLNKDRVNNDVVYKGISSNLGYFTNENVSGSNIAISTPPFTTSDLTIEFGIKRKDEAYWGRICGFYESDGAENKKTVINFNDNLYDSSVSVLNQLRYYTFVDASKKKCISKTPITPSDEYNIITIDFKNKKVYVNGVEDTHDNFSNLTYPSQEFTKVSLFNDLTTSNTNGMKADIGFFRMYNRGLTSEEVRRNYEYERAIIRGSLPPSTEEESTPLITDGLICWLDGADLTNGDTVWNDRTNNQNNFQLYNTSSFSYTGKGLKNNSNGYATLSKAITFNEYTIEIKHRRHSWQTDSLLFNAKRSGKNYDIILGYTYNNIYQCYSNSNPSQYEISRDNVPLNEDITLTWVVGASERKLYVDGVYYASTINSSGHESVDIASIDLFKYNNVCCNATIYSIKIYNRALSEDEIQKNAEYEDTIDRS